MRAAWYESRGPAAEVLRVGEIPDPHAGPGEVRIRIARSGINPGDVKKRAPWLGHTVPAYPRITAHRLVFHGDPVRGRRVLVQGGAGAVGALAVRLAVAGGAEVIATVRDAAQVEAVRAAGASHVLTTRGDELVVEVLAANEGRGVERIVDVAFAANVEVDTRLLAVGGTLASYATDAEQPKIPFWPLLFKDASIYLCGSDEVPLTAKREAANALLAQGWDGPPAGEELPLEHIAEAHETVDRGARARVLLAL